MHGRGSAPTGIDTTFIDDYFVIFQLHVGKHGPEILRCKTNAWSLIYFLTNRWQQVKAPVHKLPNSAPFYEASADAGSLFYSVSIFLPHQIP